MNKKKQGENGVFEGWFTTPAKNDKEKDPEGDMNRLRIGGHGKLQRA